MSEERDWGFEHATRTIPKPALHSLLITTSKFPLSSSALHPKNPSYSRLPGYY